MVSPKQLHPGTGNPYLRIQPSSSDNTTVQNNKHPKIETPQNTTNSTLVGLDSRTLSVCSMLSDVEGLLEPPPQKISNGAIAIIAKELRRIMSVLAMSNG